MQAETGSEKAQRQGGGIGQLPGGGREPGVEEGQYDHPGDDPDRGHRSLGALPEDPPGELSEKNGQYDDQQHPQQDAGEGNLDDLSQGELEDQGGQDRREYARKDRSEQGKLLVAAGDGRHGQRRGEGAGLRREDHHGLEEEGAPGAARADGRPPQHGQGIGQQRGHRVGRTEDQEDGAEVPGLHEQPGGVEGEA